MLNNKDSVFQSKKPKQQEDLSTPFAEIIESSSTAWQAESWDWQVAPLFGSTLTVSCNNIQIFGIVTHIRNGSKDQTRAVYPFAKTEAELRQEQPQIFAFLSLRFTCITIGYIEHEQLYYQLAPQPPQLHSFVQYAHQNQLQQFFTSADYLAVIFSQAYLINTIDELLLAHLKYLAHKQLLTPAFLDTFIRTFSLLTSYEYGRLKLLLQRIQPLLTT